MVNDVTVEGQSDYIPIDIVVNILVISMDLSTSLSQNMIEHTEFVDVSSLLNDAAFKIAMNGTLYKFLGDLFCN